MDDGHLQETDSTLKVCLQLAIPVEKEGTSVTPNSVVWLEQMEDDRAQTGKANGASVEFLDSFRAMQEPEVMESTPLEGLSPTQSGGYMCGCLDGRRCLARRPRAGGQQRATTGRRSARTLARKASAHCRRGSLQCATQRADDAAATCAPVTRGGKHKDASNQRCSEG
ncbi:hypothetical protein AXF42_Ash001741 [Apostasia shenzhenica]|uniref:Uncharacterized protein n=1 Tax=Apostasia shenzhenica TaxID=1088818 RepID=A0A2I0AB41_9ASPA|nr:hypothetical protein AXF42_Ash001741 [Apostasia shenzhenica]